MKLTEMFTRTADPVRDDTGTPIAHFSVAKGYEMSLEQGIVVVSGPRLAAGRLVPVSNIASMTPAPGEKKAGK